MGRIGIVAVAGLVTGIACGQVDGPPAGFAACPAGDDAGTGGGMSVVPDYWHDAKPILDSRCATCHTADGIAPFTLLTYADVQAQLPIMRVAIATGTMPPWPPNDCCQRYQHDRSLPGAEIDVLLRWLDAGAPEGDPAGAPPSQPPPPPRLSRVDVTLMMPVPYMPVPTEETGELRCFVIEGWPFDGEKYVTGVDVRPGNRSVVHHVIVQTVDESTLPELRAREGRDGRPGFDCKNLRSELHVNGSVGGWTPGTAPQESPDARLGVKFAARSQVLLQMHYDIRSSDGMPDQTEIDFEVADQVQHQLKGMVVVNPLWLAGDGLEISAGDADAVHTFAYDPSVLITHDRPFFVHSVGLHMHYLGSHGRVAIHRDGGPWDCLIDVPAWDYHWASTYQLAEPVEVRPGDMLYVECHWDNSAANQVPVGGVVPAPRDLGWASSQEMCAGILYYTDTWP